MMTTRTTLPLFLLLWVSTWKLPDSSNRFVGAYLSLVFAELVVVAVEWCLLVSGMFFSGDFANFNRLVWSVFNVNV